MSKREPQYPAGIYMEPFGWGVILQGHDLPQTEIAAALEDEVGPPPAGQAVQSTELHFHYSWLKHCGNVDFPCDNDGEWHGHWFSVQPTDEPSAKFTVAHNAPQAFAQVAS